MIKKKFKYYACKNKESFYIPLSININHDYYKK